MEAIMNFALLSPSTKPILFFYIFFTFYFLSIQPYVYLKLLISSKQWCKTSHTRSNHELCFAVANDSANPLISFYSDRLTQYPFPIHTYFHAAGAENESQWSNQDRGVWLSAGRSWTKGQGFDMPAITTATHEKNKCANYRLFPSPLGYF